MAINWRKFRQTLRYANTAAHQEIMADLDAIAGYDKREDNLKQRRQNVLILASALLSGLLLPIILKAAFGTWPQPSFWLLPMWVMMAFQCYILLGGVSLALSIFLGLDHHVQYTVDKYRHTTAALTLSMLGRDIAQTEIVNVTLACNALKQRRWLEFLRLIKTQAHPQRLGWKIESFTDRWLMLSGKLLDGSLFNLAVTEYEVRSYGYKRGRSGKSKPKSKPKSKDLRLNLILTVPRKKYGALPVLQDEALGAIKLPESAKVKRLKVGDRRLHLAVKLDPSGKDMTYQVITMMFLSLYQILNLARKLSKQAGQPLHSARVSVTLPNSVTPHMD